MRFAGDPDELWARVRDHVEPVTSRLAPGHGGILNVVARTDDGVLVINVWESEDGRRAMSAEPEVQEAVRSSGVPMPQVEAYEVLAHRID
jgi:hypothetical protein